MEKHTNIGSDSENNKTATPSDKFLKYLTYCADNTVQVTKESKEILGNNYFELSKLMLTASGVGFATITAYIINYRELKIINYGKCAASSFALCLILEGLSIVLRIYMEQKVSEFILILRTNAAKLEINSVDSDFGVISISKDDASKVMENLNNISTRISVISRAIKFLTPLSLVPFLFGVGVIVYGLWEIP